MRRLRAELRAFAQVIVEVFTALSSVSYRWWPPRLRVIDTGSAERVAAVRAGSRKVGIHG